KRRKAMGRTILVLGGGGVKGMAHVGAWKAVQEAGIEVAEIVGTSIGALVGACVAGGMGWNDLAPLALRLQKSDIVRLNRWALLINGIRQPSVFQDYAFRNYIRSVLPVTEFADLALPLGMNAVDLETGKMEWFGAGGRMDVPLADAVYASCALPVFYPPAEIDGRHLVDGGVGVGAGAVKDALDTVSKGIVAIQHRVFDILSYARRRQHLDTWEGPPLIYIRPRLDGYSTFDFARTQYFLEEGYRATREALA